MIQEETIDRFSYFIKNNIEKCFLYISIIKSIKEKQKPILTEDGESIFLNTTKTVYWECLLSKISLISDFKSNESKSFFIQISDGDKKIQKNIIIPTSSDIKKTYDDIKNVRNYRLSHSDFDKEIENINIDGLEVLLKDFLRSYNQILEEKGYPIITLGTDYRIPLIKEFINSLFRNS